MTPISNFENMISALPSLQEDDYAHTMHSVLKLIKTIEQPRDTDKNAQMKLSCSKTHPENSQFEARSHKPPKRNKNFKTVYMKEAFVSTTSKRSKTKPPLVATDVHQSKATIQQVRGFDSVEKRLCRVQLGNQTRLKIGEERGRQSTSGIGSRRGIGKGFQTTNTSSPFTR